MRILTWVQRKINGRQDKKRFDAASERNNALQDDCKEEFNDWPQGLLAIGTIGNSELKKEPRGHEDIQSPHSLQDLPVFTLDEVKKLEKELIKLLATKPKYKASKSKTGRGCRSNVPDKLQNCPSCLDADQSMCQKFCDELENGENGDLSPNAKIILNKAKDLLRENRNKTITQKSVSFLLKKLVVCRSGFAPAPNLQDPISESRMEKFLKAILHKKIYPQNSAPITVKKYLEKRQMDKSEIRDKVTMMMRDKTEQKAEDKWKWVKTDSEYIVLEI